MQIDGFFVYYTHCTLIQQWQNIFAILVLVKFPRKFATGGGISWDTALPNHAAIEPIGIGSESYAIKCTRYFRDDIKRPSLMTDNVSTQFQNHPLKDMHDFYCEGRCKDVHPPGRLKCFLHKLSLSLPAASQKCGLAKCKIHA